MALSFNSTLLITSDIFFESWHVYGCESQPSWNKLAHALESSDILKYKQAAAYAQEKKGMNQIENCTFIQHVRSFIQVQI